MPNITGYFTSADDNYLGQCGGSFSAEKSTFGSESAGAVVSSKVSFKASLSSSIYGNSDTVQPPAIVLIPQIKF